MSVSNSFFDEKIIYELLSKINEQVFVVNRNMHIVYANEAARKISFGEKNVLNRSLIDVLPHLDKTNSTIYKVLSSGEPIIGSIRSYITSSGERKIIMVSTFPIIENGEIVGAYEIGQDITEIHKKDMITKPKAISKNELSCNYGDYYTLDSIIGESIEIKRIKDNIVRFANSPSNALIYGETGTGKELVAQAIYTAGDFKNNGRFIAQNCACIPETLFEGILFGTVKGSFTGAEDRPGLFELANGGVLFLDEINSMSIDLQAKILRVIEERKVRRIGGQDEIPVNFKLISSTNEEPNLLKQTGKIREDLFYRINVLYLKIPPLRDRKEDIPYLVQAFIEKFNNKLGKRVKGVDEKTMNLFMNHDWPGNVRELKNIVERLVNITRDEIVSCSEEDFLSSIFADGKNTLHKCIKRKERMGLRDAIKELEIKLIKDTIKETKGNISKAARILDIPQQTLNNKVNKYNLKIFVNDVRSTQLTTY